MILRTQWVHIISLVTYVMISIAMSIYFSNGLMLFLGWNMILVGAGYGLTIAISNTHLKQNTITFLGLVIVWVLIFPNMLYMLTDFIHFQNRSFFLEYPSLYVQYFEDWGLFFQITLGALFASYLGMISFEQIAKLLKHKMKVQKKYTMMTVFTLSSIGIYIGRFLRFNSWDVLRPIALVRSLANNLNGFSIFFIILFTILHYLAYYIFIHSKKIDLKGEFV